MAPESASYQGIALAMPQALEMTGPFRCVRENSFLGNLVEPNTGEFSPEGATELSPALQRWEKWEN
jgi:hypothetical protein